MSADARPLLQESSPDEMDHALHVLEGQNTLPVHPLEREDDVDPALAAWDVDSPSMSDDSLGDDFDVYKDFNNIPQGPDVRVRALSGAPAEVAPGDIPPLSMRPKSGPLLQIYGTGDPHMSFYDTSLTHDARFSMGARSSGLFDRSTAAHRPLVAPDAQWDLDDRAPLGAEFTDMERERMTRAYRRFYWRNQYLGKIDSWLRGYEPLGGWLGPQIALILTVIVLSLIGVGLFFVIPRVPGARVTLTADVSLKSKNPITPAGDKSAMDLTGFPTGFQYVFLFHSRMNGTLHVRVHNPGWIPAHLLSLDTTVKALDTNVVVAKGNVPKQWVAGRQTTIVDVDLNFTHKSLNVTGDATQLLFQEACAHLYQGTQRPTLNLNVAITMDIGGIFGKHPSSFDLRSLTCPWELSK